MGRQPPRSGRVEGEIPGPVQGHPSVAAQLRSADNRGRGAIDAELLIRCDIDTAPMVQRRGHCTALRARRGRRGIRVWTRLERMRVRWFTIAIAVASMHRRRIQCTGATPPRLRIRRTASDGTAESFDGGFNFCRIIFSQSPDGDGANWSVDYPRADVNLSIRLSELTRTRISRDAATGEPNHVLVRLTDDLMFQCPFIMMTEVGAAYIGPEEATRLREYLLKGGFLWADDFWGEYAWQIWAREIGKALPPSEYPSSICRSRIRCSGRNS